MGRLSRVTLAEPPATINTWTRLGRSFYFAWRGLGFFFKNQRNARIEALAGVAACVLAAIARLGRTDWAILIFTIALVLVAEGVNAAFEAVLGLASPSRHPLAKSAKDLAAAMVLIAALAAVVIGVLLIGPPLLHRLHR